MQLVPRCPKMVRLVKLELSIEGGRALNSLI